MTDVTAQIAVPDGAGGLRAPSVLGVPLNRVVAFAGPHIAWLAGLFAAWLVAHVQVIGSLHLGRDTLANAIANVAIFTVVTAVTWAGHAKWLNGWQDQAWRASPDMAVTAPPVVTGAPLLSTQAP